MLKIAKKSEKSEKIDLNFASLCFASKQKLLNRSEAKNLKRKNEKIDLNFVGCSLRSGLESGDKMRSLLLVCISLLVCHSAHGQVMLIVNNFRVDLILTISIVLVVNIFYKNFSVSSPLFLLQMLHKFSISVPNLLGIWVQNKLPLCC